MLLTGNNHAGEVLYGWADASIGLLLTGDGRGNFRPVPPEASGIFLYNDHRSLAKLYTKRGVPIVLAAPNADSLVALTPHKPSVELTYKPGPLDAFALIQHRDQRVSRHEFTYGAGYLGQSSRTLCIPLDALTLTIVDFQGNRRTLLPTDSSIRKPVANR